jgi:tRNA threonylcarbamoyladenosine biosynthesis protein TsaE
MSQIPMKLLWEREAFGLVEFQKLALEIAREFKDRTVVALKGPMGAGKTEFVKTLAQASGVSDAASPTFAIHHRYHSSKGPIEHLDLYRMESEEELETTGFWDFFSEDRGLILIEWPERMDLAHIPWSWDLFQVEIQKVSDSDRLVRLTKRD